MMSGAQWQPTMQLRLHTTKTVSGYGEFWSVPKLQQLWREERSTLDLGPRSEEWRDVPTLETTEWK
jgi:hypothetical protein